MVSWEDDMEPLERPNTHLGCLRRTQWMWLKWNRALRFSRGGKPCERGSPDRVARVSHWRDDPRHSVWREAVRYLVASGGQPEMLVGLSGRKFPMHFCESFHMPYFSKTAAPLGPAL